jgi:hypothetical protein
MEFEISPINFPILQRPSLKISAPKHPSNWLNTTVEMTVFDEIAEKTGDDQWEEWKKQVLGAVLAFACVS